MNISRDELAAFFRTVFPFSSLNLTHFNLLLSEAEVIFFPAEKMVYLESSPASFFYIIYKGKVEILKEKRKTLHQSNVLEEQFFFGEDALTSNRIRKTSARALTDVFLIKIQWEKINQVKLDNEAFNKNLEILILTYEKLIHSDIIRGEEETIVYLGQPHRIKLILKSVFSIISAVGLGMFLVILFNNRVLPYRLLIFGGITIAALCIFWLVWMYLDWANDLYLFTNKRVINQKQAWFSFKTRQETPISAIKSIQANKNIVARLLDFGDLEIRTFTGSICFRYVPEIISVEHIITHLAARIKDSQGKEENLTFEKDIKDRILKPPGQQIEFSDHLRQDIVKEQHSDIREEDFVKPGNQNDVTYHTHWTILLSKVIFQITLLLALVSLYLFLAVNQFAVIHSPIFNIIVMVFSAIMITWSAYQFYDWKNDVYIISHDQLIDFDRHPFGTEEKRTAPIGHIQSIRYTRNGIFGLLFNFGTVYILVGEEEFTFNNVHRPADVQEALFLAKDRYHKHEEEEKNSTQRRKAVDWISSYHQVVKDITKDDYTDEANEEGMHLK